METCNTGQDNCQGTNHLICQDNSWVNEGDVNGFCGYNPVCSFAQTDCNGTNYLTCDNNYDWTNNGDMNGFCGYNPVCSFGDTICNGTNYYTCDNNYDWTNNGDVNGQCGYSPICLKPETSCLDTNFLTCDNNYSWTNNGDVNGQCGVNWPTVLFRKPIDGNRDCITSNVCLTRGATQGLYNSAKEAVYSSKSPIDTNWYFGSYCKDGLTLRDWNSALPGNKAPNSVNVPACLYLATDNQYYNIIFTYWRAGGGGDFNYTRTRTSPYNWNN
jgi:hypothetical protein